MQNKKIINLNKTFPFIILNLNKNNFFIYNSIRHTTNDICCTGIGEYNGSAGKTTVGMVKHGQSG